MEPGLARVARRRSLHDDDAAADDVRYWLARDPADRVGQVTRLRSEFYGYDDATESRLQRVFRRLPAS